jgi:hypothetical protein
MDVHKYKFALTLLTYAVQRGIEPEELCNRSKLPFRALKEGAPIEVTKENLDNLWTNAVRLTGDHLFGLHFAESLQLAALGVVGKLVQSSRTVGEALTIGVSQAGLIYEEFGMKIIRSKKVFSVHILCSADEITQVSLHFKQMRDFLIVFLIHELDGLLFTRVKPNSVTLAKGTINKLEKTLFAEYERVLRCRPKIAGAKFVIEFPIEYWDEPLITANHELQNLS